MTAWGVLPAAGKSTRLCRSKPKPYLSLANHLVIEHSLHALLASRVLEKIVVCLAADDQEWRHNYYSCHPRVMVCVGGSTRAQSVRCGLSALSSLAAMDDWALVHDAARPCLTTADIDLLFSALAGEESGGLLVNPIFDAVKMGRDNYCLKTLDRSSLYRALTPQMFRYGSLCAALDAMADRLEVLSDEAMAMELAGHRVRLVVTARNDVKITREDDLRIAESTLMERGDADWSRV